VSCRDVSHFDRKAVDLAERYDSITFEDVHVGIEAYLPTPPAKILDIGAGSGRDARALARLGFRVTAVEPSAAFRAIASRAGLDDPHISWVDDHLPSLATLGEEPGSFQFILCSAVLMYLPARDLGPSVSRMAGLLSPGGHLAVSIRDPAPHEAQELIHCHRNADLVEAAAKAGLALVDEIERDDALGRAVNRWRNLLFSRQSLPPNGRQ
jgi:SAM-dependent methyltransferase